MFFRWPSKVMSMGASGSQWTFSKLRLKELEIWMLKSFEKIVHDFSWSFNL